MEIHDRDFATYNDGSNGASSSNGESNSKSNDGDNIVDNNKRSLNKLITRIHTQNIIEGQGAKLDSIIRHIKYIKNASNGKCVVFSQWSKVLDMLRTGLNENQIQCIMLSSGANKASVTKFQEDPNINVILLHARSHSSGLTLVAAQTVFIVEPVFNESLEKQAINRIHRIGQTKEVRWKIFICNLTTD
jgi:E3 ubiquitin-protein ligase SHPRH